MLTRWHRLVMIVWPRKPQNKWKSLVFESLTYCKVTIWFSFSFYLICSRNRPNCKITAKRPGQCGFCDKLVKCAPQLNGSCFSLALRATVNVYDNCRWWINRNCCLSRFLWIKRGKHEHCESPFHSAAFLHSWRQTAAAARIVLAKMHIIYAKSAIIRKLGVSAWPVWHTCQVAGFFLLNLSFLHTNAYSWTKKHKQKSIFKRRSMIWYRNRMKMPYSRKC